MSNPLSRRRVAQIGAAAGVVAVIGVAAISVVGGERSTIPPPPVTPAVPAILLELHAPRDVGRLPARSGWGCLVRCAEHVWLLNESSGDATDVGSSADWHLVQQGSPRRGVVGSVPVGDATGWVDTTSELGAFFDGVSGRSLQKSVDATNMPSSTNLVSLTFVFVASASSNSRLFAAHSAARGYEVYLDSSGRPTMVGQGATMSKTVRTDDSFDDGSVHCITFLMDGRTSNEGRIIVDGVDKTSATTELAGTGTWEKTLKPTLGAYTNNTAALTGGIFRGRVDFAAITLALHDTICGSLWDFELSAETTKVVSVDLAYTQTGGTRCLAQSATTALCVPGGDPAHVNRAGLGLAWALEPDRTNHIFDSHDLTTGNWAGAAPTVAVVAPDGSLTAWEMTHDATSTIQQTAVSFTPSATVFPSLWVKCSLGTLKVGSPAGSGMWDVDCPTVGGNWRELRSASDAAVTETSAWAASGAGLSGFNFTTSATVIAAVWMPTLVEEDEGLSVIRTEGAAVATGAITWTVDNAPAVYYEGADGKIAITADYLAGACVDVSSGTQVGRQFGDATDWLAFDSSSATAYIANLALLGIDTAVIRWNSAASLGGTDFAQVLLNGIQQTWDATPSIAWTAASPTAILLDGHGSTSCTAAIQTIKIEDGP